MGSSYHILESVDCILRIFGTFSLRPESDRAKYNMATTANDNNTRLPTSLDVS